MRIFVFIFLAALAVTTLSTPIVRRLALRAGFVDAPSARKVHQTPTPLMGGLAISAGAILAFVLLVAALPISFWAAPVLGTIAACGVVVAVGLVDDRFRLPAWAKLVGQFLAAAILIYVGVRVQLPIPEWQNIALTFIWLVGITNAMNFMDNMDGLTAGVSGVAAAFILLLATLNDQYLVAALSAGILGACLGFLRYNFRPARIFMGDAGSMFLGFLLAVLALQLRFPENVNFVTWMVPVFILGLPIFDTTLVIISRARRRVNPLTTAGKDHVSHRLVAMGYSQGEAVLMLYLIGGAFGMAGLFITGADVTEGYAMALAAAVLGLVAIWRLEAKWSYRPESGAANVEGEAQ
ncbi:MAG: undecaprenyl/decaprenyl-phosphate alpha-N-acetylglucosaminyl 1-phosphate transferase [Chloroflexota bacterium]|nr:MAG: undecaprenyl/decaprenyl-phosphate alpha-N-acetylglucosaminyl 1-phosphate transferase [Chloroflexota bacterium]